MEGGVLCVPGAGGTPRPHLAAPRHRAPSGTRCAALSAPAAAVRRPPHVPSGTRRRRLAFRGRGSAAWRRAGPGRCPGSGRAEGEAELVRPGWGRGEGEQGCPPHLSPQGSSQASLKVPHLAGVTGILAIMWAERSQGHARGRWTGVPEERRRQGNVRGSSGLSCPVPPSLPRRDVPPLSAQPTRPALTPPAALGRQWEG